MAKFKIVLSDPETGKSQMVELEGDRAVPLVGRRLGEIIDGTSVGLGGHKLRITGGSDIDGFPMRPDIHGGVKTRVVLTNGAGFHPNRHGARRRKTLRGSVITEEIFQINMKITEKPKKKPQEAKPAKKTAKEEPKPQEAKKEKEPKPQEAKKREKKPGKAGNTDIEKPKVVERKVEQQEGTSEEDKPGGQSPEGAAKAA